MSYDDMIKDLKAEIRAATEKHREHLIVKEALEHEVATRFRSAPRRMF